MLVFARNHLGIMRLHHVVETENVSDKACLTLSHASLVFPCKRRTGKQSPAYHYAGKAVAILAFYALNVANRENITIIY